MLKINRLIDHDALDDAELAQLAPYLSIMNSAKAEPIKQYYRISQSAILLDFNRTCFNLILDIPEKDSNFDVKNINDFEIKKVLIFSYLYLRIFSTKGALKGDTIRNILRGSSFSYPLHLNSYKEEDHLKNKFDTEFKKNFEEVPVSVIFQKYLKSKQ